MSASDYASIMREIDSFKQLTREANDQRMRIEDEIGEVQERMKLLEVQAKRSREDIYKRLMNDGPTGHQQTAAQPNKQDKSNYYERQSAASIIKDSLKSLPGFTHFIKNSNMVEAFRMSYARDLLEHQKQFNQEANQVQSVNFHEANTHSLARQQAQVGRAVTDSSESTVNIGHSNMPSDAHLHRPASGQQDSRALQYESEVSLAEEQQKAGSKTAGNRWRGNRETVQ